MNNKTKLQKKNAKSTIMTSSMSKKGISFVPTDEISAEARLKIEKLVEDKKDRINKLVEDYHAGKYDFQH